VLTNIANVNAFGAIDAGGGFEWKMQAKKMQGKLVAVGRVSSHLPPQRHADV